MLMAKHKIQKTNAVRLLDGQKIPYTLTEYEVEDGKIDGVAVAHKIGQAEESVYKTLVATSGKGNLYVFVIPVASELNLKKAAKAVGEKKIEMLPVKELLPNTGYIRGGCSPIGMKKQYPTWIDDAAEKLDEIFVSAGKIGMQICLSPESLAKAAHAKFTSLV